MIHRRFDWRRRIIWAVVCLVFFLGSETTWNTNRDRKLTDPANEKNYTVGPTNKSNEETAIENLTGRLLKE